MADTYQAILHVSFHEDGLASCTLDSAIAPGSRQSFGECLLFSAYTLRHLVNASAEVASSLAAALASADSRNLNVGQTKRVDRPEGTAPKGFEADLRVPPSNVVLFDLKPWGFSLRGVGLEHYGPESVGVVAEFIADRFEGGFENVIARAEKLCAAAYAAGRVTIASQNIVAGEIAYEAMEIT